MRGAKARNSYFLRLVGSVKCITDFIRNTLLEGLNLRQKIRCVGTLMSRKEKLFFDLCERERERAVDNF